MEAAEGGSERSYSNQQAEKKARAKDSGPRQAPAPDQDVLARKADQLYAARRWTEAIAAYRELLHRYPDATPASQWRTRLVAAQREEREEIAQRAAAAQKSAASQQRGKAADIQAAPATESK